MKTTSQINNTEELNKLLVISEDKRIQTKLLINGLGVLSVSAVLGIVYYSSKYN